jgi:AAA lid domain
MADFLAGNSGLTSRFTTEVRFPNYTDPELLEILTSMAARDAYTLTPEAQRRAVAWLAALRAVQPADFGNGRAVRGLLGRMESRLAARTLHLDTDLSTFQPEDVPDATG